MHTGCRLRVSIATAIARRIGRKRARRARRNGPPDLIVDDHVDEGRVDLQSAVVFDEAELSELVDEIIDSENRSEQSPYPDTQRCCQSNANQSPKYTKARLSGRHLTPLSQGGGAVLLENVSAVEVAVVVEVIVDRGMGGGKFLQSLYVPELRHRAFSSSEWLMRNLGSIVAPPTAFLISGIAEYLHRRSI